MAAPPFKVKAVYEYVSEHDDDLQFPLGQVITVTELEGDDWYVGEYNDPTGVKKEGLFPANFVEKYEPDVPARPSRPTRPKQEAQPIPEPAPEPVPVATAQEVEDQGDVPRENPRSPVSPKASAPPPAAPVQEDEQIEPPPAPKPAPAQPAEPPVASAAPAAKKAPPPVASKSNAFKDRIAAFNQQSAAPIAPMQPGRKPQANEFIKKQFVPPPPSKNAYVPPTRVDPVQKPYKREEDPEIQQRQAENQAAAEAAGLTSEATPAAQAEDEEDAPKPMTLKERMALLQKQQQEQAQRRAEVTQKKKPLPPRRAAEPEQAAAPALEDEDGGEAEETTAERAPRQSVDSTRGRPPVPPAQPQLQHPVAVPAEPDMLSDGHDADQSAAGETTEDDTGTLGPDDDEPTLLPPRHPAAPKIEPDVGEEDDTTERDGEGEGGDEAEADEEEEEDSMDEEERRKQALRARMARLGGAQPGMGAMLGFVPPPPAPSKKTSSSSKDRRPSTEVEPRGSSDQQRRVPMVPVPGMPMPRVQSPESETTQRMQDVEEDDAAEEEVPAARAPPPPQRTVTTERAPPPPVPKDSRPLPPPPSQERGAPPVPTTSRPPPPEARPVPPPPPPASAPMSPGPGSESDDEMSTHAKRSSAEVSGAETPLPIRPGPPPVPGAARDVPPRPPQSPPERQTSYFAGAEPTSASSDKRSSRAVPPVPGSPLGSPRPVPPPPPGALGPARTATTSSEQVSEMDERLSSDYDGDYDTDIASSAPHKEALKAPHNRDSSLTDSPTVSKDGATAIASVPQSSAPRAVPPPPPPQQAAPKTRPSMDRPPPPIPPSADQAEDDEYDPYRYGSVGRAPPPPPDAVPVAAPPVPPQAPPQITHDQSSADEIEPPLISRQSTERARPPPVSAPLPPQSGAPRQSLDVGRSTTVVRRSMEAGRPSGEHGQMAIDVDLPTNTLWWTAPQPLPPSLEPRRNIELVSECEETSNNKRGGRKEVAKDIYILFFDYSQTVISARYDSQEPEDVHLEQRHEPPPPRLRQDQLEAAWQQFGSKIADAAKTLGSSKKDSIVADGSSAALPYELIRSSSPDALLPIGTRAYGALVFSNLANASTMQFDEIRPGDIITVRNAKFEGHHGAMKSKYKVDYGPSHVAVVEEWDGTRRAVRAWEQGRDKKGGVRSEKFRLGDLRSGEVKVWRVVGRDWVGWV